ncbi:MAG: hypothetical protein QM530_00770 [Phycisphaerales bacterium]|nr:hypothetical protein [Phycisphaerales bacterium]
MLVWSCISINQDSFAQAKKLYDKEEDVINFFKKNKIDTKEADILLIPATDCIACLKGDITFIKSIPNTIIMVMEGQTCPIGFEMNKCIFYKEKTANNFGILRFYIQYFKVKSDKITEYKAINN